MQTSNTDPRLAPQKYDGSYYTVLRAGRHYHELTSVRNMFAEVDKHRDKMGATDLMNLDQSICIADLKIENWLTFIGYKI